MTAVKICGITRREDADAAARWGADYVGFVLWPNSPRATTLERVREIVPALPASVTPVGVFVDPTAEQIDAAAEAGIRLAQVHADTAIELHVRVPVVRAVRLAPSGIAPDVPDDLILLDAHDPVARGGTGKTIDWDRAAKVASHRRIFLAGGLTPANVGDAITRVRPYAVDVASGVESSPGVKNHALLQAFITMAKSHGT